MKTGNPFYTGGLTHPDCYDLQKQKLLQTEENMSPAVLSLIIFGICVFLYIWNKIPIAVTALLGLTTMVLTGVVSFSDGFKNFGTSTIVLICAMMVVGKATYNTGLAQVAGEKVIGLAHGNERMIVILATAITAIVSAFFSNIATLAIMISILTGICAGNKNIRFMNVILPVSMAAVIGGAATLIGSTTQLTAQGIMVEYLGQEFSFSTFAIPGGLICLLLVVYCGFIGYPMGRKLWGNRTEYNETPVSSNDEELPTPDKKKMRIMSFIFIVTILLFIFCDQIKLVIPNMNIAMVSIIGCLASILTGCIDHKAAVKSVNWSLAVWFCASLGMATGLEKSGGGELLANWFIGLFGTNVSPFILYAAFLILVVVLTQFLSNSTVLAMILPVVFSITGSLGMNSFSFAVGLTIAGAMAVATPLANTTIGMSMVAKYRFSDYFKYAGPFTLIALIILLALVPALWPLV